MDTPLKAQSNLDTVKSVKIEPRSVSKYHSVEILSPDESRPPKSFSFEERLNINLASLFANIRRIQKNQERLSTRICCANTISILTFLGATTVLILTLVILYRYMIKMAPRAFDVVYKEFTALKLPKYEDTSKDFTQQARSWKKYLEHLNAVFDTLKIEDEEQRVSL